MIEFCGILHLKGNLITYISTFITDFTLLVIMLVGLLRLPRRIGSTCSLGLLLWKQVKCWLFFHGDSIPVSNVLSIRQGVIWLVLVIAVESPMVVRPLETGS